MKKFLSILFSLSLALSVFSFNVSASEVITPITNEIRTVSLESTSAEFQAVLAESGAVINEETQLELVPLSTTGARSEGSALIVTNQVEEQVVKNVIIPVGDDTIGFETSTITRSGSFTNDNISLGWDAKIIISGTAVFDRYVPVIGGGTYYRPISASFSYQPEVENSTVHFLEMLYSCTGPVYSYSDFEYQGYDYDYIIRVYSTFPVSGRTYSTNDPFFSDLVICPSYGALNGHYMTFNTRIDGRDDGITVRIFD